MVSSSNSLGRSSTDALADGHLVPFGVDAQIADLEHLLGRLAGRIAAQDRLDPRDELARVERLGHVVVGAQLQPDDLVHVVAARGEHDDRQVALLAQSAAHFPAVELGHHQVEHEQVGLALAHLVERFLAVGGDVRP